MEDIEIINLWKSNDKKINENLLLNRKNAEEIIKMKAQSLLSSMKPLKIFAIAFGIIWVGIIDNLIINLFHIANPFFLVSASIQSLLTTLAIAIYVRQLIIIEQIDINEPILKTQEKIARLKSSTLWVARLLFLQLPVWTTFYWNESMFEHGNTFLYILQVIVTISFTVIAIWLFLNIKYENRHKKWFKLIFNGKEWTPVISSMELLSQIDEYRIENKTTKKNASS
jgi:NADH:ubiquinone oxidoreductase subunit 6 (subunit J)